ncbi:Protein PSK SIMULATOR 2 [Linum perenne]
MLEVLNTLGSSMSSLNARSGFISGMLSSGNRISILAFEVANTISKGANLFQSLSEDNVNFLKKEILHSEGVKQLVSTYMKELLAIDVSNKRNCIMNYIHWIDLSKIISERWKSCNLYTVLKKIMKDIVTYLHQAILEAFGSSGVSVTDDEPA